MTPSDPDAFLRAVKSSISSPNAKQGLDDSPNSARRGAKMLLTQLCSYYLECLSLDDEAGVKVFADSHRGLDYVEIGRLPEPGETLAIEVGLQVDHLLQQLPGTGSRKEPVIGYPVRLRKQVSRGGWEGFFVEPVFLLPLSMQREGALPLFQFPGDSASLNLEMLKSVSQGGGGGVMQEAAELGDALGLWAADSPNLTMLVSKLASLRSEWDWKENISPSEINPEIPLRGIKEEGIYNRAVVVWVDRSKYTQGLEKELSALKSAQPASLHQTALGHWLNGADPRQRERQSSNDPLIEPVRLNSEQRRAVEASFCNPLTVITGPPGTGKSQVVTALLANAAKRGMRVLFASRNHKAVDVVESRVNSFGPNRLLLRLGSDQLKQHLADYLTAILGTDATDRDRHSHAAAQTEILRLERMLSEHRKAAEDLIQLRNEVDVLEQASEMSRAKLGPDIFARAAALDQEVLRGAHARLSTACAKAERHQQPFLARLCWQLFKDSRFESLAKTAEELSVSLAEFGVKLPDKPEADASIPQWRESISALEERVFHVCAARDYHVKSRELSNQPQLAEIHRNIQPLEDRHAKESAKLWESWLRLLPDRISQQDRTDLGNFLSVIQLMLQPGRQTAAFWRDVRSSYERLFPKITKILNCWAVTSLSAQRNLPLEPGFFDLVIIDEASQCDIPSAIPLLYRAKRAVIIGDAKQLQHISRIPNGEDARLLVKHGLVENHARWAHSSNSLFALASTLSGAESRFNLLDHHRSHGDIIGFSNSYFYGGNLRIATRYSRLHRPSGDDGGIRWINVPGRANSSQMSGGTINRPEAEAVIKELERIILGLRFSGTVGVVTPFRGQANLLTRLLREHSQSTQLLQSAELICESVYGFQGDERDVMIFSPVVAEGIGSGAVWYLQTNRNVFNVAVTRARSALIVVGDAKAAVSSGIDYLVKFATYVDQLQLRPTPWITTDTGSGVPPEYPAVRDAEGVSDWERYFYVELCKTGLRPIPQYQAEAFRLDFALFDGDRKLAIEIDGAQYHRSWNGELLYRDQLRNIRLAELGWDVMRFWVYEIRDAKDECIKRVADWIDAPEAEHIGEAPLSRLEGANA